MARSNDAPRGAPGTEPPRALRARGQQTRRRLLDAGVTVFEARGYHAARVDDIVKVARTSHGTFYLYFANTEELFRALATDVAVRMTELAAALPPLRPDAKGTRALGDWIAGFADLYEQSGPVIRAWTEAEIGGSEFGRLGTDTLAELSAVLARRITETDSPGIDPFVAALALVAMTERLNYYALTQQVEFDRQAMVETLTAVTQRSLFGS